jgi:hypothetical protein
MAVITKKERIQTSEQIIPVSYSKTQTAAEKATCCHNNIAAKSVVCFLQHWPQLCFCLSHTTELCDRSVNKQPIL